MNASKFSHSISIFFNPILELLKNNKKHFSTLLFFILPIVYLINSIIIHTLYGSFYQSSVDPEYFHMYNGIAIATGHFFVKYIAHPGTTIQFIIAFSARIINLFQPNNHLIEDFINNPEKYIYATVILINLITASAMYVIGIYTKKYTKSTFLGITMQLSLFANFSLLLISGRIIPETIMIIPMLIIAFLVIRYIYNTHSLSYTPKEILPFTIVIAIGIASKLSFFPVILVPLILFRSSLQQKFKILIYTIFFLAIFAYPIFINFGDFWSWVSGMITHSGKYGSGENNFINLANVPQNFKSIFNSDKLFFYLFLLSLLLNITTSFLFAKKEKSLFLTKIVRSIYAIDATIFLAVFLTIKHFALHYFFPFFCFKYLLLILMFILILQIIPILNQKKIYKNSLILFLSIFIIFTSLNQARLTAVYLKDIENRANSMNDSHNAIMSLIKEDIPIIITGPYYGSSLIEYAHVNGFLMSSHYKKYFKPYLMKKYNKSYFYFSWTDKFYFWDNFVDFNDIIGNHYNSCYVYIGRNKNDDLAVIEERFKKSLRQKPFIKEILFRDSLTQEELIKYSIVQKD